MPALVVDVEPAIQPVSLSDARDHLRLDPSGSPAVHADDDYIEARIPAATALVEHWTNIALIQQDISVYFDVFPKNGFILPRAPLISVLGIDYVDDEASPSTQVLSTDVYEVDSKSKPGRVVLADGEEWPDIDNTINAVRLRLRVGYGTAATDVPMPLRQAILLALADMYEHRETVVVGSTVSPLTVFPTMQRLISPYRVFVPYTYEIVKEVIFNEHRVSFEGRLS